MAEDADENEDSNPKRDIPGDANKDKIDNNITNEIGTIAKGTSTIMLASPASSSCAFKSCVQEQNENEYMLECSKCKQRTHYYCTQLPDYHFYKRVIVCSNAKPEQERENDTLRNDQATVKK